jgi:Protein of unknown function (DUF1559)
MNRLEVSRLPWWGRPAWRLASILMLIPVCAFVLQRMFVRVKHQREVTRDVACIGYISNLSYLLRAYYAKHKHWPPAYIADKNGRPMHSWRVLILEDSAGPWFDAYNFSEPWDGPRNRKLAHNMPPIFACPSDPPAKALSQTSYVAITGPGTAFHDGQTGSADIPGDPGRTILIAEVAHSGINWLEPRDLDVNAMSFAINDPSRTSISSEHAEVGPIVAFVNGKTQRVARTGSVRPLTPRGE